MTNSLVRVGQHVLNVDHVAAAHWENGELFIHFVGDQFARLRGMAADRIWAELCGRSVDLEAPGKSKAAEG